MTKLLSLFFSLLIKCVSCNLFSNQPQQLLIKNYDMLPNIVQLVKIYTILIVKIPIENFNTT